MTFDVCYEDYDIAGHILIFQDGDITLRAC
jgi:hypothetical protein